MNLDSIKREIRLDLFSGDSGGQQFFGNHLAYIDVKTTPSVVLTAMKGVLQRHPLEWVMLLEIEAEERLNINIAETLAL